MRKPNNLSELMRGQSAQVVDIHAKDSVRRRLFDLGLVNGTDVTCLQKSPLGDPVAFLIRGAVIALRCEDSSCVQIHIKQ